MTEQELADAAQLASLADGTPEGRSIVVLAKQRFGFRERDIVSLGATFVPFSAQTRMSGVNFQNREIRKGAADAIRTYVTSNGGKYPAEVETAVNNIARVGSTPLVVAEGPRVLGVIELKDIVKGGIKERFAQLRRMGIRTVMITGDNRLTAAAIAAEAGVDDFLAEATPEAKLQLIRDSQAEGRLVAMTGDGTNDAPALAQADVAVAMNTGTQAAKEAGNMVDLDSNPTKLIEIVETGKQLLITRGSLTTFSIANDVAKYFAIIPAAFATTYPQLNALNVMHLTTPNSAILSAVIFNALIIPALIPLALRGVKYRAVGAAKLLRDNLLVYGVGGIVAPFVGIKVIDMLLALVGARVKPSHSQNKEANHDFFELETRAGDDRADDGVTGGRVSRRHYRDRVSGISVAGRRQPDREGRQDRRLGADRPAVLGSWSLLVASFGDGAVSVQRGFVERLEPGTAEPGVDRRGHRAGQGAARCGSR